MSLNCAPKHGTLLSLLHPWTGMQMVILSVELISSAISDVKPILYLFLFKREGIQEQNVIVLALLTLRIDTVLPLLDIREQNGGDVARMEGP